MSKRVGRAKKAVTVESVMNKKVMSVDSDSSALKVSKAMSKKNISSIVLKDGDRIIGILTERDLVRNVCAKDSPASKVSAAEIMSTPVRSVNRNSSVERAAELMVEYRVRHLAVEDDYHSIIGIITTTDIAKYLQSKLDDAGIEAEVIEALYAAD
jgi:predicted transcriptional regulator